MMLKKIVAISLIAGLSLMGLLLIIGLFVPESTLERLSNNKKTATPIVSVAQSTGSTQPTATTPTATGSTPTSTTSSTGPTATAPATTSAVAKPTTPTVAAPKPTTPAPAPPAAAPTYCGGKTPCYGRADLAAHSSTSNCWGLNAGILFNLTSYAPSHPGTTGNVLSTATCGKDIAGVLAGTVSAGGGTHNHKSSTKTNGAGSPLMGSFKVGYYDATKP